MPAVPMSNNHNDMILSAAPSVHDVSAPDVGESFAELPPQEQQAEDFWIDEPSQRRPWKSIFLLSLSVITVVGWTAFFGWSHWTELQAIPSPARIANLIGLWAIPLTLLSLLWLLGMRTSRAEASRFTDVSNTLRIESQALEERMQSINGEITLARSFLAENARELDSVGRQSAQRLTDAAQQLGSALADADEKAQILAQVSNAAVTNLEQLRNHLPVVTSAAKDVTNQIGNAGRIAQSQIETLIPALKTMDETAVEACSRLDDLSGKTLLASRHLDGVAAQSASTLQAATISAHEQAAVLHQKLDELCGEIKDQLGASGYNLTETVAQQSENLSSLLFTLQSEVEQKAEDNSAVLAEKLERLRSSLAEAGNATNGYGNKVDEITASIGASISNGQQRIESFDHDATNRIAQLAFALNALAESSEKLGHGLVENEAQARIVLTGSEKLLLALDTASRELDDSLPAAFARLEQRFAATQTAFSTLLQDSEMIEGRTHSLCDQLGSLEAMLNAQKASFDNLIDGNDDRLGIHREQIDSLASTLAATRNMIGEVADSANRDIASALHNIRSTTDEVAISTRQQLENELGAIAATLSEQNRVLLGSAVDEQVARLNTEMQGAIERNLTLSDTATEQITRQLAQLNEMTSNLEARVGETQAQFAGIDDEGFARRMALLTESLNSAAIDVAKILSNDVTDTAWAAYLKGDRGVFTRRAVKLLDSNESKTVASYYDDDIEFREHVNRYIHDFETMMRVLLSTRDGNAVGITLLSSDVGKLYVALAQAIDRLRN